MFSRAGLLAVLALLAASCASAANFDRLPPIAANSASELRIRIDYFPLAAASAYVVKPGVIEAYAYDGTRWTMRSIATPTADDVLSAAGHLAETEQLRTTCRVFDGNLVTMHGAIEQRRFTLMASNPDLCQDEDSQRVNRVLQLINATVTPRPAPSP